MAVVVTLESLADLSLEVAAQVGFGGARVALSENALDLVRRGRKSFEAELARRSGQYVYGTTTQPGGRAKVRLGADDQREQGRTLAAFAPLRVGVGGRQLPARTVRLILLARISHGLSGTGRLSTATMTALVALFEHAPPPIPFDSATGPGEVMPLTWLLAPLADRALAPGEAMALVNGSPCAAGMVCEAAISARRRLTLATETFALAIEAARAPLSHYHPGLATSSTDPDFRTAITTLNALLHGATADHRLAHQAPVSWRIIPNILATAEHAVRRAEEVARSTLQSTWDNPVMLATGQTAPAVDLVSAGGFHNQQASRAIDGLNAAWADLAALFAKQTVRLIDGQAFGLPHYLQPAGAAGIGGEFLAWVQVGHAERARDNAVPATLPLGLEDPQGGQSDVAAPGFIAYRRHLDASEALDAAMATAFVTNDLALQLQDQPEAPAIAAFRARLGGRTTSYDRNLTDLGDALQRVTAAFAAEAASAATSS